MDQQTTNLILLFVSIVVFIGTFIKFVDNNYAIITIPREIKITLFEWTPTLNIDQLYTFIFLSMNLIYLIYHLVK